MSRRLVMSSCQDRLFSDKNQSLDFNGKVTPFPFPVKGKNHKRWADFP